MTFSTQIEIYCGVIFEMDGWVSITIRARFKSLCIILSHKYAKESDLYMYIYICIEDVRIIHVLYAPDVYNELHIAYLPEPQSELYKTIGRTDHCGHSKFGLQQCNSEVNNCFKSRYN